MRAIRAVNAVEVIATEAAKSNRPLGFGRFFRRAGLISSLALCMLSGTAFADVLGLTIPSYFSPTDTTNWNGVVTAARTAATTAILNPNSGPGTVQDPNFTATVTKLHTVGAKVIGYVSTSYAQRSLSAVTADINRYVALYKVDGFFIDEMTSDSVTSHIQFYQSIYNYIKGLNATYLVVGNPGTNVPEIYASLPVADQLVVFESGARSYARYQPAGWQAAYPKSRFVHMVLNVPAAQMATTVQYARTHGAGSVYVTSLSGSNPYKALPPYWTAEVAAAVAP